MIWMPHTREADLTPGTQQAKLISWLALIAIVGIAYFFVAVVALHFLRPEFNLVNHAVSNYAVGPYGFLMVAAFFVLALSVFALALGLARSLALTSKGWAGVLLLCIASVGMVVMGIFPGDVNALHPPATITGLVHWTAAGLSFLSIMIAAFILSSCFKMDRRWRSFQRISLVLAVSMVVALLVYGILALIGWIGIGQRIYIIVSLMWVLFTAVRLRAIVTKEVPSHFNT
jgi:hypothetical membrane protein